MCLIGLRLAPGDRWPLIIAANRDEFHGRPTDPVHWWPALPTAMQPGLPTALTPAWSASRMLAGRDQLAGGTWLGLRADPGGRGDGEWRLRLGALTNIRPGLMPQPVAASAAPRSRGELVSGWLGAARATDPQVWLAQAGQQADRYAGFNLLAIEACWPASIAATRSTGPRGDLPEPTMTAGLLSSAAAQPLRPTTAGLHLITNGLLGEDWPKARRLGEAMAAALQGPTPFEQRPFEQTTSMATTSASTDEARALTERLLHCLADRTEAMPGEQPDTGLDPVREQALSAIFIADPLYGTRASTVMIVDALGHGWFTEQSWGPDGQRAGRVSETFGPIRY